MEFDFEKLRQKGEQMVDAVQKTAGELAQKGKDQLDLAAAQSKLTKAQRQLGELVYQLIRNGEENKLLVQKYVDAIGEIEQQIKDIREGGEKEEAEETAQEASQQEEFEQQPCGPKMCPQCKEEVSEGAMFCSRCGAQL